ncbi:MAG: hypothetical protein ABWX85_09230 [Arthrobacter sp.]
MKQFREALVKSGRGRPAAATRRTAAANEVSRYRLNTLVGTVIAGFFVLFVVAAPAHADAGEARESLRISGARLSGLGAEVRVHVSYHCQEGQTAGVGVFLTQTGGQTPAVFGGAGSGQRPCTGEAQQVTLSIRAGSGRFNPGCAAATVSLIVSGPGAPDKTELLADDIRLERS